MIHNILRLSGIPGKIVARSAALHYARIQIKFRTDYLTTPFAPFFWENNFLGFFKRKSHCTFAADLKKDFSPWI